jgi:hypothetical protein
MITQTSNAGTSTLPTSANLGPPKIPQLDPAIRPELNDDRAEAVGEKALL